MNSSTQRIYIPLFFITALFGIYLCTVSPVVYVGDSGELTAAAFSLGVPHPSGYPLYSMVGKLFCMIPLGNIGFRINLMSIFFSVLTVWIVYSIILKITSSVMSSFVGASVLAFSSLFWSQTVSAEVYPLHTFFVALMIRLLLHWDENREFFLLALFAFVSGLSFDNHLQTVMLAPAVLFIILSGDKKTLLNVRQFLVLSVLFFLALSLYLYLPIRTEAGAAIHWGDPNTLDRFFAHVSGRAHRAGYVFNNTPSEYWHRTGEAVWIVCRQFGFLLMLALWGLIILRSNRWKLFFILVVFFDLFYTVFLNTVLIEVTPFNLPTSVIVGILVGAGIADLLERCRRHSRAGSISAYTIIKMGCCIIPCILLAFNFGFCNQSANYIAYEHALNILRTVENRGTVFLDGDNNLFPVTYGRVVEQMREDISLYDRNNLFFKMPYMDTEEGSLTYYGKWEDLGVMLERRIIEKTVPYHDVYFSVFNPFSISIQDEYAFVPFGILRQVVENNNDLDHDLVNKIWSYYSTESFYDTFERDYMTREVTAYFHFNRGKHLIMLGARDAGLENLRLASRIGHNDDMIHSDMGLFLADHGLFEEAREELEKAFIYYQDLSGIHNNWGYYYSKLGDHEKAIKSFKKAIKLNPENVGFFNNLAFELHRLGREEEANLAFQESLSIKKDQPRIEEFMKAHNLGQGIDE